MMTSPIGELSGGSKCAMIKFVCLFFFHQISSLLGNICSIVHRCVILCNICLIFSVFCNNIVAVVGRTESWGKVISA